MIEKWKKSLDNHGIAGGILMDLSKAFDTINHELLIAKLHAYGFSKNALELILNYLKNRWHRTKINLSYSSWAELLSGVPQGTVLGPLLFNIYINDLFYIFTNTDVCNLADDTTPYACDTNLSNLMHNLESDTTSAIMWFEANYMKLNEDKCHFLFAGNIPEHIYTNIGNKIIWESSHEKLLGLMIDKKLSFETHLNNICKKASSKVTALSRMFNFIPMKKKRLLMKAFIESQFSYCSLLWMFCSRNMNNRINHIHERALRLVYEDYTSSFDELLLMDNSFCIHHRNIQKVAIEMFKIKNNMAPILISALFNFQNCKRTKSSFQRPKINSVHYGVNSLRNFGPIVWDNMIPKAFHSINNLEMFKKEIKNWKPDNCTCRLCREYVHNIGFVAIQK